jgi:hypothetical protein
MKNIKLLVGVTALVITFLQAADVSAQNNLKGNINEYRERDEIRQTFRLAPDARVEVSSIRGSVEIETANIEVAEIYIVRSAKSKSDLNEYKIDIQNALQSLIIRGETRRSNSGSSYGFDVRHKVKLRLPRRVNLSINTIAGGIQAGDVGGDVSVSSVSGSLIIGAVKGQLQVSVISGGVTVGQVGGRTEIKSVSGNVKIARADNSLNASVVSGGVQIGDVGGQLLVNSIGGSLNAGAVDGQVQINVVSGSVSIGRISGQAEVKSVSGDVKIARIVDYLNVSVVSGRVTVGIAALEKRGVEINSVSGQVEIQIGDELNAQLIANNISGKVSLEIPKVTVQSRPNAYAMRALIGKGGSPISINVVTSDVRFVRGN